MTTNLTNVAKYHYYSKDHLGNVRSVVTKDTSANTVTEVQKTHYYPFGGIIADLSTGCSVQNRLYNGKELDTSNNLWWYDYGARQYDPTASRFITADPLAEKYYGGDIYGYCEGNPVKYIDYMGKIKIEAFNPNTKENKLLIKNALQYDDNKETIHLFAHGNAESIVLAVVNTESPIYVSEVSETEGYNYEEKILSIDNPKLGEVFSNFINISMGDYGEPISENSSFTLVLHACKTGMEEGFAQSLSKVFPSAKIIAPNNNLVVENETLFKGVEEYVKNGGKWIQYENGKQTEQYSSNFLPK